jgi:ribonuclease R
LQNRFEIQRVIEEMRDKPESGAVNFAVLRTMQKAEYGPQEEGHYALASQSYCHFTSPIGRFPYLRVIRLLVTVLRGDKHLLDVDALLSVVIN